MADNTQLNTMSGGDTIQTEDFGAAGKIQRIKLAIGVKDTDNGDVSATNPLPISATSLPLPTGGSTSANQTTANSSLATIVTNTGNIPVSPSTSAKQDTGNASLASIDTKTPALGQALATASVPVVLPAAQVTTLTPPAAITNYANETGGNLASIKTNTDKIPAQGQALAAASLPVVLPAVQITTLTPPAAITNFANETGGNLAAAKADLDTLAGIVSSSKAAVKSADGDQATFGAKADTAITDSTTANTHMAFLKGLVKILADIWDSTNHRIKVDGSGVTQTVSGTVAATQSGVWNVGASSATGSAIPANAFYIGGIDGSSVLRGIGVADRDAIGGSGILGVTPLVVGSALTGQRQRTSDTFKTATATASGNTAVWTPTTGKKFRLIGYYIAITGDCATASGGEIDITFQDSTTDLGIGFSIYVPATSVTTNPAVYGVGFVSLGNGKLSAAANNVLNVNLSAALSSGKVRVQAVGTEE